MVNIRRATKNDVEIFFTLRLELFKSLGKVISDTDIVTLKIVTKEYFIKNLDNNFMCWLAEYDSQVVGCSGFNIFHRLPSDNNLLGLEGYIMNIYTLPEYRGKGIATTLVREIINYSKMNDIKRIWLHATKEGKYVYSKLGFTLKESEMELIL